MRRGLGVEDVDAVYAVLACVCDDAGSTTSTYLDGSRKLPPRVELPMVSCVNRRLRTSSQRGSG